MKRVLGPASKNVGTILDRCGLRQLFDAVVDRTLVSRAKPAPEAFLRGAEAVRAPPAECVVFEAAARSGMRSVGVGDGALDAATLHINFFEGFTFDELSKQMAHE